MGTKTLAFPCGIVAHFPASVVDHTGHNVRLAVLTITDPNGAAFTVNPPFNPAVGNYTVTIGPNTNTLRIVLCSTTPSPTTQPSMFPSFNGASITHAQHQNGTYTYQVNPPVGESKFAIFMKRHIGNAVPNSVYYVNITRPRMDRLVILNVASNFRLANAPAQPRLPRQPAAQQQHIIPQQPNIPAAALPPPNVPGLPAQLQQLQLQMLQQQRHIEQLMQAQHAQPQGGIPPAAVVGVNAPPPPPVVQKPQAVVANPQQQAVAAAAAQCVICQDQPAVYLCAPCFHLVYCEAHVNHASVALIPGVERRCPIDRVVVQV